MIPLMFNISLWRFLNVVSLLESLFSPGANSACQLSMLNIGKTWKRATIPFHVVQQGAILVRIAQCHEHTLCLCQHRGNPFGSHDSNMQSSGTHNTPESIQMDSHSVLGSSALSHVT